MKKFCVDHFKVVAALVAVIMVIMMGAIGSYASGTWAPVNVAGVATITVTQPPTDPTLSVGLYSDSAYSNSLTSINFSGTVVSGNTYSVSKTVYIKNTGTNGTNGGGSARVNGISVSSSDLPSGWTIANSSIVPIDTGAGTHFDVVLSSGTNVMTSSTTLPSFNLTFAIN